MTAVADAPLVTPVRSLRLSTSTTVACAWITAVSLVLTGIAFFVVSGYVPPPHADASAQEIANFYADNTGRIRAGILLLFVSWAGWGTLVAGLATQMARIEGSRPILTVLMTLSGMAGWMFLLLPTLFLGIAAYRPERSPETTQTLHDLGWMTAFFPFVPFVMMGVALAVAIFQDPSPRPVFPRWLAYANIWAAILFLPGGALMFFHDGVFSYHGLFVFWVPFFIFGAWILVLAWAVRYAALNDRADTAGAV